MQQSAEQPLPRMNRLCREVGRNVRGSANVVLDAHRAQSRSYHLAVPKSPLKVIEISPASLEPEPPPQHNKQPVVKFKRTRRPASLAPESNNATKQMLEQARKMFEKKPKEQELDPMDQFRQTPLPPLFDEI